MCLTNGKKVLLLPFLCFTLAYSLPPQPKIALLFLTRSDFNQCALWSEFLDGHRHQFNVYIHPKLSIQDPRFRKYVIQEQAETAYWHTVKAEQALLRAALKESCNVKFVLLSEACIPLASADEVYARLLRDNRSAFHFQRP